MSVMLFHAEGGFFVVVCSETIVIFTFNAFEIHLDGLLGLPRMLITVSCLLI